jgi:peptide/nickel transport system substrate-binding protein
MTVVLVACGGSSELAANPVASEVSKKAEDVQLAPTVGILATSVPEADAAKPTSVPMPTVGAVATARDTVRIITSEEANTFGASSNNCTGNIPNTICDDWISDPLTWVDNKTFEIVPLSPIESWEQTAPDRWQFKLRGGITFHSGNEWNSEHAAFWISYFGDEETSGHSNSNDFSFHGVFKGEAVDPLTLDIVCKNACPILPRTTIFTKFMDKDWWESASEDERETNTMGLGPYKLVEWRRGIEVEMEAYEGYKPNVASDSRAPAIKHAYQIWRNEPLVRAAMLQADEADWAEITLDDRDRVPQFKVATNNEVYLYAIDTVHHPELSKVEVREALNLAIDCDTLMAQLYDDLLKCYGNIAQTGTVGVTPENSAPVPYDPDRARQLLKDAGYDPANKIILHTRSQKVVKDVEYAEAVVTYWQEVGINAEL